MNNQTTTKNWREYRRLRAWELKQQGWQQKDIAIALGVSEGAVSQWMRRVVEGGIEALRHRPPPGAPPRLKSKQYPRLVELLEQGAEAHGFTGEVWTHRRVAALIKEHFGVDYSSRQAGRILRKLGFTPQKPARRANQRDEDKITHWQEETWPQAKKRRLPNSGPSFS